MRGRDALGESLRDLAHALGAVIFAAEHVALGHVEADFGMVLLFDEALDELVGFLAEGLANRVQENED